MALLNSYSVTHVSYVLVLYSVAFLLFLFVNVLLHLYAVHAWPESPTNGRRESRAHSYSHSRNVSHSGPGTRNTSHLRVPSAGGAHVRYPSGAGIPSARVEAGQRPPPGGLMNGSAGFLGGIGLGKANGKIRMPRRHHRQTDSEQIRDAETFELEGLIGEISDEDEEKRGDGIKNNDGRS